MQLVSRVMALFFNLFEPLFRLGQRVLGVSRIGWLFVAMLGAGLLWGIWRSKKPIPEI